MKTTKILLIADHIGIGGIPRYCLDLIKHQKQSECNFVMAAFVSENENTFPDELKYPILSFGPADIGVIDKINQVIIKEKPDCIITQGYKSNIMTWLAFLRFRFNARMLTVQHGILFPMNGRSAIYFKIDILMRRFLRVPTIAVSHDTAMQLINNWKIKRGLIRVLHNPVEKSRTTRSKNKIFTIGFASRLVKEKGIEDLLHALRKVNKKHNFRLLIAGDGPLEDELKSVIQQSVLKDKVLFLGGIKDMSSFYKQLDLFVFPSWGEGLPYVVLEAMAAEIPVIASEVGGIPEIIRDKENGYLIEAGNIGDLSTCIEHCMENEKELSLIAKNAEDTIKQMSFNNYYKKLLAIIDSFD